MDTMIEIMLSKGLAVNMYQRIGGEYVAEITDGKCSWVGIDAHLLGWALSSAVTIWEKDPSNVEATNG